MKKTALDYSGGFELMKSVVEEVVMDVVDGKKGDPAFKLILEKWHPNLIAYIAQTSIKAWENGRIQLELKKDKEKFENDNLIL